MLRLAAVFFVWIASTAWALDDTDADYDAELHEAYVLAWSEADERQRRLLERAQRGWNDYRAANCELVGNGCYALMAQERAAELRHVLTNTNVRTIIGRDGPVDPSQSSEGELRTDLGTDKR
jgi:ferric-dicitrate binding protein FerR (iron transport regulator)